MELPPGFRFFPTDEELITHYLQNKVRNNHFSAQAIGEADLNKCEPWDLPGQAKIGEKEWYFFSLRDRKYPTGTRTNRATGSGYWKATGKDKEIYDKDVLVGMKKTLVFYSGRAPRGAKSNWVMHEYRLEGKFAADNLKKKSKNEWVICRVYEKAAIRQATNCGLPRQEPQNDEMAQGSSMGYTSDVVTTSNVPCLSTPMETANSAEEAAFDPGLESPANVLFAGSDFPTTISRDYVLLPSQSVLWMVMQNRVPDFNMSTPSEYSQESAMSSFPYNWS